MYVPVVLRAHKVLTRGTKVRGNIYIVLSRGAVTYSGGANFTSWKSILSRAASSEDSSFLRLLSAWVVLPLRFIYAHFNHFFSWAWRPCPSLATWFKPLQPFFFLSLFTECGCLISTLHDCFGLFVCWYEEPAPHLWDVLGFWTTFLIQCGGWSDRFMMLLSLLYCDRSHIHSAAPLCLSPGRQRPRPWSTGCPSFDHFG